MKTASLPSNHADALAVAQDCVRFIRARNPHLRMIAISGSLTRDPDQREHSDVDFFAIAQKGQLWAAFFGCILHGWRFARRLGLPRTFFCFNYLVSEAHLEEIDLARPEYVREFLRLEVLTGHQFYTGLLEHFGDRLQPLEPDLYERAHRRSLGRPEEPPTTGAGWANLYRALHLPFLLTAKFMEARRQRRYPGGFIYSNNRVIRSHFRRFWAKVPLEAEGLPAARAFSNVAADYDDLVVHSPANRHMRSAVRSVLEPLVFPGMRVLDLGSGTGVDAIWLAQRGAHVLAIDAAAGMVQAARQAVKAAGLQDWVQLQQLPVQELATLLPQRARSFDLVLSNFGVLNLSGEPESWAPVVARLLKPGGHLVTMVVNRFSGWELLAGLMRGRLSFALRRLRKDPIVVGGVSLATDLYWPDEFVQRISTYFTSKSIQGLCVFAPPPTLEHLLKAWPSLWSSLCWVDRKLGRLPAVRACGDHFLVVLKQHSQPLFDKGGMGFITAAPVVADINGDGACEVLVASDRLHVLNGSGKRLGGWPRRIGGPMASTPWVRQEAGTSTIYIGSDDNNLYGLTPSGTQVPGFPIRTGGDLFSSPQVIDLPDRGATRIVFGSDDGGVYAVDLQGGTLAGWPFRTGGFVSASPVVARIGETTAVVIGSWDRNLYAIDHDGKVMPGWPRPLGFAIWSSAGVADLDGDGQQEIAVATDQLFVFHGDGTDLPGFPVRLGAYAVGSPAIGDLDGDGQLEIVIGADQIYAFRADGSPLPGFPFDAGAYIWASPILVDVDGDGRPEIVVGDFAGRLWAVSWFGRPVLGYPIALGNRITAAATAADLDGDRHLEIIVASADGRVIATPTECPQNEERAPWPTFLSSRQISLCSTAPLAGSRERVTPENVKPVQESRPPVVQVRLKPGLSRPFRVTEVHITTAENLKLSGMLHYRLDGIEHPSPFLAGGGHCFALVQPLPPLRQVQFWCELGLGDGRTLRVPEHGAFGFRVGIPGLFRTGGTS